MKNILCIPLLLLMLVAASRCTQPEPPGLDSRITDLKIVVEPGDEANTFVLTANHNDVIGYWTLGNGSTVDAASKVIAEYPFAGSYTVALKAYGAGGQTNNVSITITVTKDNFNLIQDPVYALLCGGINNPDGKTWIVDSALRGHIVMWNANSTPSLGMGDGRACAIHAVDKGSDLRMGPTMYDDEVTFFLTADKGPAFEYNTGDGAVLVTNTGSNAVYNEFMKTASWAPSSSVAANSIALPAGYAGAYNSDWQVSCTPPRKMTWTIIKGADGGYTLQFPPVSSGPGGFLMFNTDWNSGYQIKSLTEDRLIVWKKTLANNTTRQIVLIKKGTPSGKPVNSLPELP
jgi:hypothetical protein